MGKAESIMQNSLKVGDFAPDFTLDTDGDGKITLSELRGKNVVLYFYPKDDTPGCTMESKEFAEAKEDFDDEKTIIIGISKDNVKSHNKFKEKYCLPFTLASDSEGTVCDAYGVWVEKNMYGKKYMGIRRDTFLIDKKGTISKIWHKVKPAGHAAEVLETVRDLN